MEAMLTLLITKDGLLFIKRRIFCVFNPFSAYFGHVDAVATLIDADAIVDVANNLGLSPLHLAASRGFEFICTLTFIKGHTAVILELIDAGAYIKCEDNEGTSIKGKVFFLINIAQKQLNCYTKQVLFTL